ncbi:MAG: hypothetical protein JWL61_743 [Gemmatimonadetes bacterium]|jgi:hypothetical protein|nr:hypothetical protein [Gemmatimonadota bacterium]
MSDHTILVDYNAKHDTWTLTPASVSLEQKGWIIFRREPASFWRFVSVAVYREADDTKSDWPSRVADDGSAIWLYDNHKSLDEFRYTLTVVDGYGTHTGPPFTPAVEPPIIKNDGSGEP